jgi:hypothetical protein
LYEIKISTNDPVKMFGATSPSAWLNEYQNKLLRYYETPYAITASWLPSTFVNEYQYSSKEAGGIDYVFAVDNINYFYEDGIYNMVFQCHAKLGNLLNIQGVSNPWRAATPTSDMITITRNEYWRPMIKIALANGYVKIRKQLASYVQKTLTDGRLEREYIIEIPCVKNMHTAARMTLFQSDANPLSFTPTQIMMPVSYIRAGATIQEDTERVVFENSKLFTTMIFAASDDSLDSELQTYGRTYGGGIYSSASPKGAIITYPKSSVFRQVIPQYIGSETVPTLSPLFGSAYDTVKLSVLSGVGEDHNQIAPNFEAKMFVLYDNRKWKFANNEYESFLASPYPTWVFEVDASALLNELDVLGNPGLPDVKRWVSAYCRGFGLTHYTDNGELINVSESSSEMVLEIWDNKSIALGCYYQCVVDKPLNSNIVTNRTYLDRGEDGFDAYTLDGKQVDIAGTSYTVVAVTSPSEMTVTGAAAAISGLLTVSGVNLRKPNWRSITVSRYDVPKTALADIDNSTFIDEDRNFVFGATTITADNKKIRKYLDLKKTQTDAESEQSVTDLERYVDGNNKMRFRVRIKPKIANETSKVSADLDDVVVELLDYNYMASKIETVLINIVAVADNGMVAISETGSSWLSRDTGFDANLNGIDFGSDIYVAVGDGGTILTSSDGVTWTQQTSNTTENLRSVCHEDGRWVAVGDNGIILRSMGLAIVWTVEASPTTEKLNKVKFVNRQYIIDQFIAVGDNGTIIYADKDGATWTLLPLGYANDFHAVATTQSEYILIGGTQGKLIRNNQLSLYNWDEVSSNVSGTIMDMSMTVNVSNNFLVTDDGYVSTLGSSSSEKIANNLRCVHTILSTNVGIAVGHDDLMITETTLNPDWVEAGDAPIWNITATFPPRTEDLSISGLDYFQVHSL